MYLSRTDHLGTYDFPKARIQCIPVETEITIFKISRFFSTIREHGMESHPAEVATAHGMALPWVMTGFAITANATPSLTMLRTGSV
jgi:hypothetical protein